MICTLNILLSYILEVVVQTIGDDIMLRTYKQEYFIKEMCYYLNLNYEEVLEAPGMWSMYDCTNWITNNLKSYNIAKKKYGSYKITFKQIEKINYMCFILDEDFPTDVVTKIDAIKWIDSNKEEFEKEYANYMAHKRFNEMFLRGFFKATRGFYNW